MIFIYNTYLGGSLPMRSGENSSYTVLSGCDENIWTNFPTSGAWNPMVPLLSLGALGLSTEADLDRHLCLFGHGHQGLTRRGKVTVL